VDTKLYDEKEQMPSSGEPPTDDFDDGGEGDDDKDPEREAHINGWFACYRYLNPGATADEVYAAYGRYVDEVQREDMEVAVWCALKEHGPMTVQALAEAVKADECCGAEDCQDAYDELVRAAVERLIARGEVVVVGEKVRLA
jgi:hypothetical protein